MKSIPVGDALDELIELIREDAETFACVAEVSRARQILKLGSSADRQLQVYDAAGAAGLARLQALKEVVSWLHRATAP